MCIFRKEINWERKYFTLKKYLEVLKKVDFLNKN